MSECNGFHLVTCSRAGMIRFSGLSGRGHTCSNRPGAGARSHPSKEINPWSTTALFVYVRMFMCVISTVNGRLCALAGRHLAWVRDLSSSERYSALASLPSLQVDGSACWGRCWATLVTAGTLPEYCVQACAGVCSTEGAVSMRLGLFCPPRCGAVCAMRWGVGAVLVETR